MMNDLEALERWLYSVLNVSEVTDLVDDRIYADFGRSEKDYPQVVFQVLGSESTHVQWSVRRGGDFRVMIKVIGTGDSKAGVQLIAAEILSQIEGIRGNDGSRTFDSRIAGDINEPYTEDGIRFHQVGYMLDVIVRMV